MTKGIETLKKSIRNLKKKIKNLKKSIKKENNKRFKRKKGG
jgi:chaperonin cofactor prefoldin